MLWKALKVSLLLSGFLLGCDDTESPTDTNIEIAADAGANLDLNQPEVLSTTNSSDMDLVESGLMLPDWTAPRSLAFETDPGVNIQPAIAFDGLGKLWLAFTFLSERKNQILLQQFGMNGEAVGLPLVLVESEQAIQNEPAICGFDDGGVVVVWSVDTGADSGANLQIGYRRVDADGSLRQPAATVNTEREGNHWLGSVACNNLGGFMIVGSRSESNNTFGIFAQIFDQNGLALPAEGVNENEMGGQVYPVAAYLGAATPPGYLIVFEDQQSSQTGQVNRLKARFVDARGSALGDIFYISAEGVSATQPAVSSVRNDSVALVGAALDNEQIGLFYVDPVTSEVRYRSGSERGQNVQVSVARHTEMDAFVYLNGVNRDASLALGRNTLDSGLETPISIFEGSLPPYQTSFALTDGRAAAAVTERTDDQSFKIHVIGFGYGAN